MRTRDILWASLLLPFLAGCSSAPVASEFGDASYAPSSQPERRPLDCKDPRSIRDFKDYVLADVNPDFDEVESWAVCLCGRVARRAGVNAHRPRPVEVALATPSYDVRSREESLAEIQDWFKGNLPITEEQAAKLADCLYGKE
jgi:hypothetical protein